MIRSVRLKTFAAWLGLVALAMAAIVPVETAGASSPETIVLCTGHGVVTVPANQSGAPAGKASGRAHCECCLHAPPMALPTNEATTVLRRVPVRLVLLPDTDAAGIERVFTPEQPRAPPAV